MSTSLVLISPHDPKSFHHLDILDLYEKLLLNDLRQLPEMGDYFYCIGQVMFVFIIVLSILCFLL